MMDGEGARVKEIVDDRIFDGTPEAGSGEVTKPSALQRTQEPGDELVRRLMLAHTSVFADPESTVGLEVVLALLLQATDSTDGFIAEVVREGAIHPILVRSTGSGAASGLYVDRRTDAVDLARLDAVVDALVRTGCVAVSPEPDVDASNTGALSYLGLPIIRAGELVGVSVVANRPAGYAMSLVDRLSPFLVTAGVLIDAARNARFRRAAERDLTRSAELLKDAHELANLGSFHFDLTSRTAVATPELWRILGQKSALDLKTPSDLTPCIHADDRGRWVRSVQRCLSEGAAFAGDFRIVVAKGRVRHLHVRCRARRDASGIVREGSCTLQDVTKRVLTDRAFHASEARRARLWERVTRVQDEERRRIARELHDHAGATLAALLLRCKLIESAELPQAAKEEVATLARQLEDSVAELSRLARGLHPASLDELGLGPALQQLVRAQSAVGCIDASVYIDLGDGELPPSVQLAAYRIAQEALTNVVRHSGARHINARCACAGAFLVLSISDDGRGFDPASLDSNDETHGLGLMGMRERAHFAGGKLEISSSRATGTRIEARFPLTTQTAPSRAGAGST